MSGKTPTRKVAGAGIAGAIVTVALWIFDLASIEVPPLVAGAFVTITATVTGWFVKETA